MKGTVQECKLSTSGKSYSVKIDGKFYSAKLDSKLDTMVGKAIDFDTESTDYKGKTFYWITTWGPDHSTAQAPVERPQIRDNRTQNGDSRPNDRWFMPFVSNTIAHCIQAGLVKDSQSLSQWATAAYRAAMQLENAYANKAPVEKRGSFDDMVEDTPVPF